MKDKMNQEEPNQRKPEPGELEDNMRIDGFQPLGIIRGKDGTREITGVDENGNVYGIVAGIPVRYGNIEE